MPDDIALLMTRLIGGTADSPAEALRLIDRATRQATTSRERQLLAIAAAHLRGEDDVLDVLVRDHLADHPDHALVAWLVPAPADAPADAPAAGPVHHRKDLP